MTKRRLRLADYLHLTAPGTLAGFLGVALLLAFGWYGTQRMDSDVRACRHAYGRARTAADSAVVDRMPIGIRASYRTCGRLRVEGRLREPGTLTEK